MPETATDSDEPIGNIQTDIYFGVSLADFRVNNLDIPFVFLSFSACHLTRSLIACPPHFSLFLPLQAKLQLSDYSLLGSFQLDLLNFSPLFVCVCFSVFSVYVSVCDTLGKDTMVNSIKKPLIFQRLPRSKCPPTFSSLL